MILRNNIKKYLKKSVVNNYTSTLHVLLFNTIPIRFKNFSISYEIEHYYYKL